MKLVKLLLIFALTMPLAMQAQTTCTPTRSRVMKNKKKSTTAPAAKPATAATPAESKPIMTFPLKYVNFGKIKTGDKPSQIFEFTNTGNADLDIDIVSGCDCTELDWTRSTVKPGQKGYVKAIFNTVKAEKEDHKKALTKYVDIVLKQTNPKNNAPWSESVKFDVFIVD
jgi:hypothetical protein